MVKCMMAEAGNIQNESVLSCCAKCKKCSINDGDASNELKSQLEGVPTDQICKYLHI